MEDQSCSVMAPLPIERLLDLDHWLRRRDVRETLQNLKPDVIEAFRRADEQKDNQGQAGFGGPTLANIVSYYLKEQWQGSSSYATVSGAVAAMPPLPVEEHMCFAHGPQRNAEEFLQKIAGDVEHACDLAAEQQRENDRNTIPGRTTRTAKNAASYYLCEKWFGRDVASD